MEKQIIHTDRAAAPIGPYSQAVHASGNFLFLSGQIALLPDGSIAQGGVQEQTKQILQNIDAVLQAAGAGAENVIKTTVFLMDMNDFAAMNEIYGIYFNQSKPARSTVQVSRLPKDVLVEIEVIACL
jgi:2-iminobutanoate/2-iminopropanoate deaminase